MPRTITALQGEESLAEQIPVSLVRLEIPRPGNASHAFNFNDIDITVYLNPATNAVSMAPGTGLVPFVPAAGLTVPEVELNDEHIAGDVNISLSNVRGTWFDIMTENIYREVPATIWQGNLVLPTGSNPNAVVFRGAVKQWAGRVEAIDANRTSATITLSGLTSYFAMTFPYRTYTQTTFIHMPKAGAKLKWGYTDGEY